MKTFKEIITSIPYFKEHPEQYTRDQWYFFPEDEEIYWEDIAIILDGSDKKKEIMDWAKSLHDPKRIDVEHKESLVEWLYTMNTV